MNRGLTIGQAAAFAGVTIKTVRHYHRLRLVGEPQRDGSGYRRYGSAELLRLLQVRTLAEAGVPLAHIGALLGADPQRFASDIADVKTKLNEKIDQLIARRDMLDRLAAGNRLLLPDRACALLDRGVAVGMPEGFLDVCREGLILARVLVEDFDSYLDNVEAALKDPEYVELMKRGWEASTWSTHDPRVEELASDFAAFLSSKPQFATTHTALQGDAAVLINDYHSEKIAPAVARLSTLTEAKLREGKAKARKA